MHLLHLCLLHHRFVSTKKLDFHLEGKVDLPLLLQFNSIMNNVNHCCSRFKQPDSSNIVIRHHFLDPSKPDSSHSGNENNASEGVSATVQSSVCSEREITIEPPDENSDLVIELPKTLRYDCSSPDGDVVPSDAITTETMPDLVLASFDELLMDDSKGKHHSFKREINLRRICSIEQNEEACSWVTLVSDAADLLFVDLSNNEEHFEGQDHKSVDPGTMSFISTVLQLPQDNANDLGRTESVGAITSCKPCEIGETATQSREIGDLKETDPASAFPSSTLLDKLIVSDSSDEVDHKGQKCMQARSKVLHCFDLCFYRLQKSIYK